MKPERRTRVPNPNARDQAREDVDKELEFHLDRLIEANMQRGMDEQTARSEAMRRFGDLPNARDALTRRTAVRERRIRRRQYLAEFAQDIRHAVRSQRRDPVFTLAAVLTLALGIGANTAIFGVAHGVLFESLPYARPDRLVLLWQNNTLEGDPRYPFSPANYRDLIERTRSLESVAAYTPSSEVTATIAGESERVRAAYVSTNFFDAVGVQPALGRGFQPDEGVTGGPPVAVISDAYWRSRFAGDPAAIGRTVDIFGTVRTIVGVMPPAFTVPTSDAVDVVGAIRYAPESWTIRAQHSMRLIARLREGATVESASREANQLFAELDETHPLTNRGMRVTLLDLRTALVGDVRPMLLIVLCAAGMVLLVACANITNLLLARASERTREFSIRAALGAGRLRLVRQVLTESAVLALAGASAGLLLATFIMSSVRTLGAASLPMLNRVDVSPPVVLFALALTMVTALLVGTLPAVHGMRARASALRTETRGSSASRSRQRTRRVLVVAQVAMSLVLLMGAILLIRSYLAIMAVDPGFTTDRVLTFSLTKIGDTQERLSFFGEVERRLEVVPGVTRVGAISMLPLTGSGGQAETHIIGGSWGDQKAPEVRWRSVTAGYFDVMDLRLRSGRTFDARDAISENQPLILNEEAARRIFGERDPLGYRVRLGPDSTSQPWTVVGVVENARNESLTRDVRPEVFAFNAQIASGTLTVVLRTAVEPASLLPGVRNVVASLDPTTVVADVRTTRELISASVAQPRFIMIMLGSFAALGLLLAVVGTYGVLAYFVAQRHREIGIRMALGADRSRVLRLIGTEGARLAAYGIATGVVIALVTMPALSGVLFGIRPADPIAYAGTIAVVGITSLLASGIPAWRAARLEPGVVMRHD